MGRVRQEQKKISAMLLPLVQRQIEFVTGSKAIWRGLKSFRLRHQSELKEQ
jgi:hypothetical protein